MADFYYSMRLKRLRFYLKVSDMLIGIAGWFDTRAEAVTAKVRRELDLVEKVDAIRTLDHETRR